MIKNILAISVVINSVLIMAVVGPLPFFLYLSVVINCAMVWYIQKILNMSNELNEDVLDLFAELENYSNHLDQIHEMETFYGDQNLQNLINHTRSITNNIIDIQKRYDEDIEILEEKTEEEVADEETSQD